MEKTDGEMMVYSSEGCSEFYSNCKSGIMRQVVENSKERRSENIAPLLLNWHRPCRDLDQNQTTPLIPTQAPAQPYSSQLSSRQPSPSFQAASPSPRQ